MTSLRKWRFPILIGAGLLAAGLLVYFANTRVGSEKTQGAIGQRDVYRDGQVNSADVATPGSAPVATQAILNSGEYKELAKNAAFQELMKDGSFARLSKNEAFLQLISDRSFQELSRNQMFAELVRSESFQQALNENRLNANMSQGLIKYQDLTRTEAFNRLSHNAAFLSLARNDSFARLLSANSFRLSMAQPAFMNLMAQPAFQGMVVNGLGGPGRGRE
jgi:hypothetical protein